MRKWLFIILIKFGFAIDGFGQEQSSQIRFNPILRWKISPNLRLDQHLWYLHTEQGGNIEREVRINPRLFYKVAPHVELFAGGVLAQSWGSNSSNYKEFRPSVGVFMKTSYERPYLLRMFHRYEYRLFHYGSDLPKQSNNRFRFRGEAFLSLNWKKMNEGGNIYLRLDHERFANLNKSNGERLFNGHRSRFGPGYIFSKKYQIELLYSLQVGRDLILKEAPRDIDHLFFIRAYIPLN